MNDLVPEIEYGSSYVLSAVAHSCKSRGILINHLHACMQARGPLLTASLDFNCKAKLRLKLTVQHSLEHGRLTDFLARHIMTGAWGRAVQSVRSWVLNGASHTKLACG